MGRIACARYQNNAQMMVEDCLVSDRVLASWRRNDRIVSGPTAPCGDLRIAGIDGRERWRMNAARIDGAACAKMPMKEEILRERILV